MLNRSAYWDLGGHHRAMGIFKIEVTHFELDLRVRNGSKTAENLI
jgi:hypothetical protein